MKLVFLTLVAGLVLSQQHSDKKFTDEQYELIYNADIWHEERGRIAYNKITDNYQSSIKIEVLKGEKWKDVQKAVRESRKHQVKMGYVMSSIYLNSKETELENLGKGVVLDYVIQIPGMTKELKNRTWIIQSGDDVFKISTGHTLDHFDTYIMEVRKVLRTLKKV